MQHRGWIALDIDGTITQDRHSVPKEVISFLKGLYEKGWSIIFASGRSYSFARKVLESFSFPCVFLSQNGSLALEMPEKKILFQSYIPLEKLPLFEEAYKKLEGDFLIFAGFERGDCCYWRPSRFEKKDLPFIEELQKRHANEWKTVEDFHQIDLKAAPLIACFGSFDKMEKVKEELGQTKDFEIALIQDPFKSNYFLLLITDKEASKGKSLQKLIEMKQKKGTIIAAGDDENDQSLLKVADVKIAMHHAPESLKKMATHFAPPTSENGIIHALELAIKESQHLERGS